MHRTGKDLHIDHIAQKKKKEKKIDSYVIDRISGKLRVLKYGKWITVQNERHLEEISGWKVQ